MRATIGPGMCCLGPKEVMISCATCPFTLNRCQGGPIMVWSAKIHANPTLEQNRHFSVALRATIGPGMCCLGPKEVMIFCATCPFTLNRCHGGPIMVRSAKIHANLTLEQNGHFSGALRATIWSGMGYLSPKEALISCAAYFAGRAPYDSSSLVRI